MADRPGAITVAPPSCALVKAHVRGGGRIHVDDTTVAVLAKGRTRTGQLWTVVRDDRPFGGTGPPATAYVYSPDRAGSHAETWLGTYVGIAQGVAFSGLGRLHEATRRPATIMDAVCRAHARRKFFEMADLKKAPIEVQAVGPIGSGGAGRSSPPRPRSAAATPQLDLRGIGRRRASRNRHVRPIETAKLNGMDPRAWLENVFARLPNRQGPARH